VLNCIEKQHKKQEKVGHKLESIERMRTGLSNYKMDGQMMQMTKTASGRNARAATQTNRYNRQTDYSKYFMSSSDEEAELAAVEQGYGQEDADAERIGLSRRDRRAAKRDQQKWDDKADGDEDDDAASAEDNHNQEEEVDSGEESDELVVRGGRRGRNARDCTAPVAAPGRRTRGRPSRSAQAAQMAAQSNQRLLPFGRRGAPSRRNKQRVAAPGRDNDLLDRYGY